MPVRGWRAARRPGVSGGGAAGAVGAHEANAQTASGATKKEIVLGLAARRQTKLSLISDPRG